MFTLYLLIAIFLIIGLSLIFLSSKFTRWLVTNIFQNNEKIGVAMHIPEQSGPPFRSKLGQCSGLKWATLPE